MEEYQDRSLGGRVFKRVREDILKGSTNNRMNSERLPSGKNSGLSRTPVREQLRQLELEGVVTDCTE